jgi:hypothetical protein
VSLAEYEPKVLESLAVLEASGKNKDESSQVKTLLANMQLVWEELVSLCSIKIWQEEWIKSESCLKDTCNQILEDATALRNDTDRRLKIF